LCLLPESSTQVIPPHSMIDPLTRSAEVGATAYAQSAAFITSDSRATVVTPVETSGTLTLFVARAAGPSDRRRARIPLPSSSACGALLTGCPNLRGVIGCIDTTTDIFSTSNPSLGLKSPLTEGQIAVDVLWIVWVSTARPSKERGRASRVAVCLFRSELHRLLAQVR